MTDEAIAEPATGTELVTTDPAIVATREHGSEMTMAEFGQWIENNIGGSIAEALEQGAFMLCADVISQDIAKATLRLRERLPNGTSRIVMPDQHPIAAMLAMEPNRRHTWIEYTEMSVYWECLTSNAYSVVFRDKVGDPLEVVPVQTGRVRELVEGRDVFYEITASTMQEQALLGASMLRVPERDMIHVRARMIDGMDGYSTMTAGKKTLAAGKAMDKFKESLFGDEGQIRGVFLREDEGIMPEEAFTRLRSQFKILMNKFRQMVEPIVLEGKVKFQPISSKPSDMEFVQHLTAQVISVCRLMRVPPHKVFALDSVKYENLETMEKSYVGDTLVPRCERREQRYGKVLLSPKDRLSLFFEHDREEMMVKDTKAETERAVRSLERGAISWDEYRGIIGKNPLPNGQGESRIVPTNMTVVGKDGKVIIAGSSTKPNEESDKPKEEPAEEPKKGLRLVQ